MVQDRAILQRQINKSCVVYRSAPFFSIMLNISVTVEDRNMETYLQWKTNTQTVRVHKLWDGASSLPWWNVQPIEYGAPTLQTTDNRCVSCHNHRTPTEVTFGAGEETYASLSRLKFYLYGCRNVRSEPQNTSKYECACQRFRKLGQATRFTAI